MQFDCLQKEEKRKILSLVNYEYVDLDCSKISAILGNNCDEPRWMDVYVLLYNANLPPDITIYNILLEKLSQRLYWFYYEVDEKNYLVNADERLIKSYLWYQISKESTKQKVRAKYIPHKDYVKEICKIAKFADSGLNLKHVSEDKFIIEPLNLSFENVGTAANIYDDLLDWNDFYRNVKMDKHLLYENYDSILKLSKDKRMLATISNVTNFFDCKFGMKDGNIIFENTDIVIYDESSATEFQAKIIDAYHFFRNVINTKDKKDIISEIYNQKVDITIKKEFEENAATYINASKNTELIDWVVTISKESNYTLDIKYDEQGVFYIDGAIIVTPLDAKEYYIDFMDRKNEKLAVAIYKNNIVTKIKKIWNKFRARFAKA